MNSFSLFEYLGDLKGIPSKVFAYRSYPPAEQHVNMASRMFSISRGGVFFRHTSILESSKLSEPEEMLQQKFLADRNGLHWSPTDFASFSHKETQSGTI